MKKYLNLNPVMVQGLIAAFLFNILGPIPGVQAQQFILSKPGAMVLLSPPFNPPILKGIKVHPENPFRFEFILDRGDSRLGNDQLKSESTKLIKYFLASLTIPEKDLWVNLSPYEKDRIIPQSFGLTEMGRDLLAEDYMLKQITASLIYPEGETGKKFWKRIYEEASKKFGTTNIPVNTFNKVWIVPEKAIVYENAKAGTAYVVEAKLKVMLEEDYLSLSRHSEGARSVTEESKCALRSFAKVQDDGMHTLGSQIVREIVIPELTKEINTGKNFTQLRQIYNSFILAAWYKKKIKESILVQVYENKNKIAGININDPQEKQKIYERYLQAFKKGVYNYIKDTNMPNGISVPRKYFSGGVRLEMTDLSNPAMSIISDSAMIQNGQQGSEFLIGAAINPANGQSVTARSKGPMDHLQSQWLEKLDESKSQWQNDSRFPIPYSAHAPIAYDPNLLDRHFVGPFLWHLQAPPESDGSVTRDQIRAGRHFQDLTHELPNMLMPDFVNSNLAVIPNRWPKAPYASLLVTRLWTPQFLTQDVLEAQIRWAKQGATLEFHRLGKFVNHSHTHIYAPKTVPIQNYAVNFKKIDGDKNIDVGELEGYMIPHVALTSSNENTLMKAIVVFLNYMEGADKWFYEVILKDPINNKIMVLFFPVETEERVGISVSGLVRSKYPEPTEHEIMSEIHERFMSKSRLAQLRAEFWQQWNKFSGKNVTLQYIDHAQAGPVKVMDARKEFDSAMRKNDDVVYIGPKRRAVLKGMLGLAGLRLAGLPIPSLPASVNSIAEEMGNDGLTTILNTLWGLHREWEKDFSFIEYGMFPILINDPPGENWFFDPLEYLAKFNAGAIANPGLNEVLTSSGLAKLRKQVFMMYPREDDYERHRLSQAVKLRDDFEYMAQRTGGDPRYWKFAGIIDDFLKRGVVALQNPLFQEYLRMYWNVVEKGGMKAKLGDAGHWLEVQKDKWRVEFQEEQRKHSLTVGRVGDFLASKSRKKSLKLTLGRFSGGRWVAFYSQGDAPRIVLTPSYLRQLLAMLPDKEIIKPGEFRRITLGKDQNYFQVQKTINAAMISQKVVLTGATGFMGSILSRAFLQDGVAASALVLNEGDAAEWKEAAPGLNYEIGTLLDMDSLRKLVQGQSEGAFINLAANTNTAATQEDVELSAEILKTNVLGAAIALLVTHHEAPGMRKIFISSFDVEKVPPEASQWVRDTANTISQYSINYYHTNGRVNQSPDEFFHDIAQDYKEQSFRVPPYPLSKALMDLVLIKLSQELNVERGEVINLRFMGPIGVNMLKSQASGLLMRLIMAVTHSREDWPKKITPYEDATTSLIMVDDLIKVIKELSVAKLNIPVDQPAGKLMELAVAGPRISWKRIVEIIVQTAQKLKVDSDNLLRNINFTPTPAGFVNVETEPDLKPLSEALGHPIEITPLEEGIVAITQEAINLNKAMRSANQEVRGELRGGIDLSSDKALTIQNNGQGIKFHIDPGQLAQLQNAPGFMPVIISIVPMINLRRWLGLS